MAQLCHLQHLWPLIPHTIERVQKFFLHITLGQDYVDYKSALETTNLETLVSRRWKLCKKYPDIHIIVNTLLEVSLGLTQEVTNLGIGYPCADCQELERTQYHTWQTYWIPYNMWLQSHRSWTVKISDYSYQRSKLWWPRGCELIHCIALFATFTFVVYHFTN